MATQVITGRDVSLSFSGSLGTDIDAQALSATLTKTMDRQTYQTLDGEAYKTTNVEAEFTMEILADWGKTSSVCEALWTAADNTPDTTFTVTMTVTSGHTFAFDCLPAYPAPVGGTGADAQTATFTFKVSKGAVTESL
jgi:hypothetical protein